MNSRISAAAAALACCVACVKVNPEVGGNMIPDSHQFSIVETRSLPLDVSMDRPDSLSGYSSTRFCVGALRDPDLGISKRSCVLTLVPLHDTLDFGTNPAVSSFKFFAAQDTTSVANLDDRHILQSINVYEMKEPVNAKYDYDCNGDITSRVDFSKKINRNPIILKGVDSLSFNFTTEYAQKYLGITQDDLKDFKAYCKKFPGIYLECDEPVSDGGRFNFYRLQLDFDSDYYSLNGNYAQLNIRSTYKGVQKDTSFFFYFSPDDKYETSTLFEKYGTGSFPQSCLNLTSHDKVATAALSGNAKEKMFLEGGGGLKPHISAMALRNIVRERIMADGHSPENAIINKASVILHYEAPDEMFEDMHLLPAVLSPTVRLHKEDTTQNVTTSRVTYYGLTDSSNSNENQGDIDNGKMRYCPDITYHLQEILRIKEGSDAWTALQNGERDLWMLSMAYETTTTTTSSSSGSELSDYYSMLAYQSYYQSMYGGYGGYGYGGYGYGGYGYGDPYSNYYSYMMAAMYASSSSTSTSTSLALDKDRFYKVVLYGPEYSDEKLRPAFEFSYAVPKGE